MESSLGKILEGAHDIVVAAITTIVINSNVLVVKSFVVYAYSEVAMHMGLIINKIKIY